MKIRKKITLWISGTVVLSTLVFSSFVFFEMMEQTFLLIDKELASVAKGLVTILEKSSGENNGYDVSRQLYNPDNYWIKVTGRTGKVLYQSRITRFTDIQAFGDKTTYMVEKFIPRSQIWLDQDEKDEVFFRVRVLEAQLDSIPVTIRIAKPIETIEEEVEELIELFIIGLGICTLGVVFVSFKLSGKIMSPVAAITALSKNISEKSLDNRIPLGKSRDELYDLSSSLNKMFDRLQYSFLRQKEFVGNASHELKSPITRLLLAQEDMLINQDFPARARKGMMKQLETTRRMSQLVKQLLDLSRLEQQDTLDREKLDIAFLITRVLDEYEALFSARGIKLTQQVAEDLFLYGDPEKLYRLFINLIDNSIRYNLDEKGRIIIKSFKTKAEIGIKISNTGIKIPEDELNLVFEQFYRVEKSRSTRHGGSGLGLAIAKKIVQLHDGTIEIYNTPDQLITVRVSFPFFSS